MAFSTKQISFIICGGVVTAAVVGACVWTLQGSATSEVAFARARVFSQPAVLKEMSDNLTFPARVTSKISAAILSESDGIISQIPVRLGERIAAHKEMMQVVHTDPVLHFAPLVVRSPLAGVISSLDVTEGAQVTKGQKLASVTDPARLRVVIEVPSEDREMMRVGLGGDFRFGKDRVAHVKLQGLGPFVDPETGTASCEFEISQSSLKDLAAGMVGRVSIDTNRRSALLVPEYAVVYKDQMPFVRILNAGKVHFSSVTLGKKSGEQIEILDGVKVGEIMIERSSRFVADGEEVDPEEVRAADGNKAQLETKTGT